MSTFRTASLTVGAVLFAGVIGLGSYTALGGKMPGARDCPGGITNASIGGPFELTSQTGARMGSEQFKGKPSLVYFGYTTCPDVCPLDLAEVGEAVDILADEHGETVQSVFITIDPERDTVEKVGEYAGFFHDDMVGLTGTPEEIAQTAKSFKVFYQRVPDPEFQDGYLMSHSNTIYLLDENAEYKTFYRANEVTPKDLASGVACHIG